ncbi:MAG: hypothetical protein KF900_14085 [Bacteroidetes bacterium]|nr:hypothetical protein [Bacteroidota bacterium]
MSKRIKISLHQAEALAMYLQSCIGSPAKTEDKIKEFLLARGAQSFLLKTKNFLSKLSVGVKRGDSFVQLSEHEALSLCVYFQRYQLPVFLFPFEATVLEIIRAQFPELTDMLLKQKNKLKLNQYETTETTV